MEKPGGKEWNFREIEEDNPRVEQTSVATEEGQQASNSPGTTTLPGTLPAHPLPSKLPPVNLLHRDILQAQCQLLELSKGQKLDVSVSTPLPTQIKRMFPSKAEAIIQTSQRYLRLFWPCGDRITAKARTLEAEESLQEACGVGWCGVHSWVHLFHAGHIWVPGKPKTVFLAFCLQFHPYTLKVQCCASNMFTVISMKSLQQSIHNSSSKLKDNLETNMFTCYEFQSPDEFDWEHRHYTNLEQAELSHTSPFLDDGKPT
ncbi:Developmental pluripotency-associated protein 4, partial [Plecturocebus cupreus]